jgi:hypothetical protein
MIVVRDEIENIVNSFKSSGAVDSFVDNTGSYTITTSSIGNLQAGFKVVLQYSDTSLNRDVVISAIDSINNTFTFSGTSITQPDTWEMALYYEYGHRIELHKKYTNKAKSGNKRIQEYPLIWLFTDFTQEPGNGEYIEFSTELGGAIVDQTEYKLYEDERITQKYKPVLYPIFELFESAFNTATNKKKFVTTFGENGEIRLSQTDRPFFGSSDVNANILPQYTDAIEWGVSLNWFLESNNCQQSI